MDQIKKEYQYYLYKYIGAELFIEKKLDMDESSNLLLIKLIGYYKQASKEFENAYDIESLNDIFYKYKIVMNETVDLYITTYCDTNKISYEKIKYNEYLINNRKLVNIEDGFTYTCKTLNKIARRKKIVRTFLQDVKDVVKFR